MRKKKQYKRKKSRSDMSWQKRKAMWVLFFFHYSFVTLSAKTSLMLGVHKAGFRREGHNFIKLE